MAKKKTEPKPKEIPPLLHKITFNEDYRTFKKGDVIEIKKPFLVLVGVNGCGKSTILDCIREEFGIADNSYMKGTFPKNAFTLEKSPDKFEARYHDFHSGDRKYSGSFGDDMSGQIAAMHQSSGIGNLLQFQNTKIKHATNSLILLDEPDRGMAIKIQRNFGLMFLELVMAGKNQVIVATHSEQIMTMAEIFGQIYSVEHKRFFDTKDEFIKEHLK
jgi:predicted ATPase